MIKLTIERSKWLRGGGDDAFLLNLDGKMCCLGFLGKVCGYEDSAIRLYTSPATLSNPELFPQAFNPCLNDRFLINVNTKLVDELIDVNDSESISEQERENRITELMLSGGVEVIFV